MTMRPFILLSSVLLFFMGMLAKEQIVILPFVIFVVKKFVKDQLSDALIFSLILMPMLLFGLMTGKVAEFSGGSDCL